MNWEDACRLFVVTQSDNVNGPPAAGQTSTH